VLISEGGLLLTNAHLLGGVPDKPSAGKRCSVRVSSPGPPPQQSWRAARVLYVFQ